MMTENIKFEDKDEYAKKAIDTKPHRSAKAKTKVKLPSLIIIIILALVAGFAGSAISLIVFADQARVAKSNLGSVVTQKQTIKVDENSAVIDASEKAKNSVVSIVTSQQVTDFFGNPAGVQEGGGTGFILTADGIILTNKHVASSANTNYTIFTSDGKSYDGKVVSVDPLNDLAIIKINANNLPVAALGNSDDLKIGQQVIAIGNALGQFQNTVTSGIISAKDRTIDAGSSADSSQERLEGMLQTDAAINPGNSGGPLVDLTGQVVGINTAIASQAQGLGFAIPINSAKVAIESYQKNGKIIRPMLGVRYVNLTKELAQYNKLPVNFGALVYSSDTGSPAVVSGSPADKAGLKQNDIITAINGDQIDENHSLSGLLQKYQPGDQIEVTYLRDGKTSKVKLTLDQTSS